VFEPEGLLLSASISGYKEVIDMAYDIPALSQNVDFINVMAYDYHGGWDPRTGHLAPLFQGPLAFDSNPTYNAVILFDVIDII
jgi:chitinase